MHFPLGFPGTIIPIISIPRKGNNLGWKNLEGRYPKIKLTASSGTCRSFFILSWLKSRLFSEVLKKKSKKKGVAF